MAKIGVLLLLLTHSAISYAWWCSYSNGDDGWYKEGSMYCEGISVEQSLEEHYCVWYRPDDPVCTQYQQTICVDTIEYQTLSCPPNHSGGLQQSRTYVCQQASWTDWQTTSNNCTANPPSCLETSDTRTVECPSGYEGQITETRVSQCPDPYGEPQWLDWHQSEYGCTQSVSDPVSPISVTSPTNPVSPTAIESATAPQVDAQSPNPVEPTVESVAQEKLSDSDNTVETSTSDKADSTKEVKQNKQERNEKQSKNNVDNVVDDGKEIVHGFGLVLSLEILQKPMEFYQPPLEDLFSITQEFPIHESTREFQLDLFKRNDIEDYYYSLSDSAWERIRRSDILQ